MKNQNESCSLRRLAGTKLPTKWGDFTAIGFEKKVRNGSRRLQTAVALVKGDVTDGEPLLRIHSQCLTGDAFGSLRCDCGEQLELALHAISREGRGLLIYEHQEGRGIGLMAKLQAYSLQDHGLDTIEANHALGYEADCRDFSLSLVILRELGVGRVRLLSNNPEKARFLSEGGVRVVNVLPCEAPPNPHSFTYLQTKKERMGHTLNLGIRRRIGSVESALGELRAGRMVVVVDDEDRENEGDLIVAGPNTNGPFMIKDSKKYATSGGWGSLSLPTASLTGRPCTRPAFPVTHPLRTATLSLPITRSNEDGRKNGTTQ